MLDIKLSSSEEKTKILEDVKTQESKETWGIRILQTLKGPELWHIALTVIFVISVIFVGIYSEKFTLVPMFDNSHHQFLFGIGAIVTLSRYVVYDSRY